MTYEEKYNFLTENEIATEDEIDLVVRINGTTEEQLDNILWVRTGYSDFGSYILYECSDIDDIFDVLVNAEEDEDFDKEGYKLFYS